MCGREKTNVNTQKPEKTKLTESTNELNNKLGISRCGAGKIIGIRNIF